MNKKQTLKQIWQYALAKVNGETLVKEYLHKNPQQGEIYLIAIGKAAAFMAKAAHELLHSTIVSGIVITKYHHSLNLPYQTIETGHPIPDENSLKAGRQLLKFIQLIPDTAKVLFLLSGGASALVEVLPEHLSLNDIKEINKRLLSEPLAIDEINKIRQKNSLIKGGKLLNYFKNQAILELIISDVPNNNLRYIGSGLLHPTEKKSMGNQAVKSIILASIKTAMTAAKDKAQQLGYEVFMQESIFQGDAQMLAQKFAHIMLQGPKGIYIWGGESTVHLPENPGAGGRNQHLALAAAKSLNSHPNIALIALGTDGTDGPSIYAGAYVDGLTIEQGCAMQLEPDDYLEQANSGTYLEIMQNLIKTGATGSNVMDLVIGISL